MHKMVGKNLAWLFLFFSIRFDPRDDWWFGFDLDRICLSTIDGIQKDFFIADVWEGWSMGMKIGRTWNKMRNTHLGLMELRALCGALRCFAFTHTFGGDTKLLFPKRQAISKPAGYDVTRKKCFRHYFFLLFTA